MTNENARTANGWIDTEESAISRIMAEDGCARLEAIRIMRRRAEPAGRIRIPKMNVSREADTEFTRLMQHEDSERYARLNRNMRKDSPNAGMTEEQAISNFIPGLPTGSFRFAVIAGRGAPVNAERDRADDLLRNGKGEEWVQAIMALANAPEPEYVSPPLTTVSTPPAKPITNRGGRPKLTRSQKAASQSRRRAKVRANVTRFRDVPCNQKTPSQLTDYGADTTALFAST